MPEADRELLLLRAEGGLSYDEIAALVGGTAEAARLRAHRARKKLMEASMSEDMMGRLLPESIGPAAQLEKAAFRETQLALRERTSTAIFAMTAAALVFACLPEQSALIVSVLRKGGVWLAGVFCAVSLGFWWRFFRTA